MKGSEPLIDRCLTWTMKKIVFVDLNQIIRGYLEVLHFCWPSSSASPASSFPWMNKSMKTVRWVESFPIQTDNVLAQLQTIETSPYLLRFFLGCPGSAGSPPASSSSSSSSPSSPSSPASSSPPPASPPPLPGGAEYSIFSIILP